MQLYLGVKKLLFLKKAVIKCSIYIHIYIYYLMFFRHNIERVRELKLAGFFQGHGCLIHLYIYNLKWVKVTQRLAT